MSGPRIVFERPTFSKWGVRVSMIVVGTFCGYALFSNMDREVKAILGGFIALSLPFFLLAWSKARDRVELDGDGVTIVRLVQRRTVTWREFRKSMLPARNWNDHDVSMPAELRDVEPLFELVAPPRGKPATELERAAFFYFRGEVAYKLFDALFALRATHPDADWQRLVATAFRAQTRYHKTRGELPTARAVG